MRQRHQLAHILHSISILLIDQRDSQSDYTYPSAEMSKVLQVDEADKTPAFAIPR